MGFVMIANLNVIGIVASNFFLARWYKYGVVWTWIWKQVGSGSFAILKIGCNFCHVKGYWNGHYHGLECGYWMYGFRYGMDIEWTWSGIKRLVGYGQNIIWMNNGFRLFPCHTTLIWILWMYGFHLWYGYHGYHGIQLFFPSYALLNLSCFHSRWSP